MGKTFRVHFMAAAAKKVEAPASRPLTLPEEHVKQFESDIYRATDALRRAGDAWSFDDIARTNFDYVDKQLIYCLDAVSRARTAVIQLIRVCEEQVQLAEEAEYDGAVHVPLFPDADGVASKGGA